MSEEEYTEEEVEEDEEAEVKSIASSAPESVRSKRPSSAHRDTVDESTLTEAEKAMIAAKKRHEDEEAAKLQDYEERRRIEREKEEQELKLLKEKQEQRRLQREEEEREQAERRKQEEERRRQEEEERKARIEEERLRKEEAIRRRQQLMGAGFVSTPPIGSGGRNFIIPEKKDKTDKFGNIVQAKQEMGMTSEQQEEAKRNFLASLMKQIDVSGISGSELKAKIKEMHQRICKLETEKYDLEKRHERQIYDLKEMNERQRQINRLKNKHKMDPSDMENSRYPPKVSISSKYDRQIDRRNFKERKSVFDKKDAFPCFPNVPPPPTILEYKVPFVSNGREEGEDEEEEE